MRVLLAVLAVGLCLSSLAALARDHSEPHLQWRTPELQLTAGIDADKPSESVRNGPKDRKYSNNHGNGRASRNFRRFESDSSLIRAPNEGFIGSSVLRTAIYSDQNHWNEASDSPAIWITLSQRGLDYVKDVLLTEVLKSITPFPLPDISKTTKVPFIGDFDVSFTNITLNHARVPKSTMALSDLGLSMQGLDAAANLTLSWQYAYDNIWLPIPLSDDGTAKVKVEGMQAGVAVGMQECSGTLCMNVLQCGTYIDKLDVQIQGESSWFYQWLVDGLEEQMCSTIEEQLSEQIQESVQKLNSALLQLPQQVQVDDMSELNFSVVSQPIITKSSLSIGVKGQFVRPNPEQLVSQNVLNLPPGLICDGDLKMATMALSESVLADAASIYYNADLLNWLVDKLPDQTLLNTNKWRFLIPQLYEEYPNKEITLHFEVSAPPNVTIAFDGVDVSVNAQMIIGVMNGSSNIPVACISITAAASGVAGLNENNITGQVALKDLTLVLEWSNMGRIHMTLVKVLLKTLIKDAALPILNKSLKRGLPLPVIPFMILKDSIVAYRDGYLLICTDILYLRSTGNMR